MKIGDSVLRRVHTYAVGIDKPVSDPKKGKVVYVHPKGRYHTVQFDGLAIRESYMGTNIQDSKDN